MLKCESVKVQYRSFLKVFRSDVSSVPLPSVRFEPTFDPNTVYRHMKLSDADRKVTMLSENLKPPDHPERFVFWRQVLCREPLAGSPYYWEVEWSGQKVSS